MDFHSRRPHRRVVLCSTSHSPPPTDPQIPSERLLQFSQLTAGAVSGIANVVILSPLEVVKVRMQAQARGTAATAMPRYDGLGHALRVMLRDEGWRSYYRGMNASLWAFVPNWAVFWYSYEGLKRRLGPQHNGQGIVRNPTANHVASAFGAGAITAVATAPMWTLKSRLQTVRICLKFDLLDLRRAHPRHLCYRIFSDVALLLSTMFGLAFKDLAVGGRMRYSSVWGGLRKIVKDEGFRAMYKGLSPTMLGLGHVMLQFPIYEAVRSKMCQGREEDLKPVHVLVASSVSKVVASAAFYHHEVVRLVLVHVFCRIIPSFERPAAC